MKKVLSTKIMLILEVDESCFMAPALKVSECLYEKHLGTCFFFI